MNEDIIIDKSIDKKRFAIFLVKHDNLWKVIMEDIILEKQLLYFEFETRKEALEYMSNLYDQI